jgi:hypothetical protein
MREPDRPAPAQVTASQDEGRGGGQTLSGSVRTGKQVAQGPVPAQRQPDPAPVLGPVVQQMAPLAQGPLIAVPPPTMGGIMVHVCCR